MKASRRQFLSKRVASRIVLAAVLALSILAGPSVVAQGGSNDHWVGTWATAVMAPRVQAPPQGQTPPAQAPQGQPAQAQTPPQRQGPPPISRFNNQTLRQTVHTSIGGERVRVVLSNAFGTEPLLVGAAKIARREKGSAIVAKSDRTLTFSGRPTTTIAAGSMVISDAVNLNVPPVADLAIDIYLPEDTASAKSPLTMHATGLQTNYVSETGDHTGAVDLPVTATTQSWFFLSRVEVMAPQSVGAFVTFGDSITDGTRSTPDTNSRWPDQLTKRLAAQNIKMGVLNLGISGNRVLTDSAGVSALARFDRDVLVQPGVTHVVVMEDDIGQARQNPSPSAADLIAGHQQLVERAHLRGLRIYAGTLTPFEGANYFTQEGEAKRKAVNEWIRTQKGYDGVIDFDAVLRDPNNPTKFLPQYDSGDHLHPNDAGYQAMANAVDLAMFKARQLTTAATR